jgi:hypothetical protein
VLQRSQGVGLTIKDLQLNVTRHSDQPRERPGGEIEKAPDCARLQKILWKDVQSAVSSLWLENGEYTKTERERDTLEELLCVHVPGSKIILEPSGGWDSLELKFFQYRMCPGGTGWFPEGL